VGSGIRLLDLFKRVCCRYDFFHGNGPTLKQLYGTLDVLSDIHGAALDPDLLVLDDRERYLHRRHRHAYNDHRATRVVDYVLCLRLQAIRAKVQPSSCA
jgi:hypothetical protein